VGEGEVGVIQYAHIEVYSCVRVPSPCSITHGGNIKGGRMYLQRVENGGYFFCSLLGVFLGVRSVCEEFHYFKGVTVCYSKSSIPK
jgi:hypothetical protein